MIYMEVAGMSRIVFKIIVPILLMAMWLDVAYYVCLTDGQLDWTRFVIVAGLPYGIKAMGGILYPVGFDLQGGIMVLALNLFLGAFLGVFALVIRIFKILWEIGDILLFDVILRKLPRVDESTY